MTSFFFIALTHPENFFGCAANRKIGKAKDLPAPLFIVRGTATAVSVPILIWGIRRFNDCVHNLDTNSVHWPLVFSVVCCDWYLRIASLETTIDRRPFFVLLSLNSY
jgi:hypothetical protein